MHIRNFLTIEFVEMHLRCFLGTPIAGFVTSGFVVMPGQKVDNSTRVAVATVTSKVAFGAEEIEIWFFMEAGWTTRVFSDHWAIFLDLLRRVRHSQN